MKQRRVTNEDRFKIEALWRDGANCKTIAEATGIAHATICREIRRGFDGTAIAPGRCGYSAEAAIQNAEECRNRQEEGRHKPRKPYPVRRAMPRRKTG